jgi:undecaprenyl-diphosphatase
MSHAADALRTLASRLSLTARSAWMLGVAATTVIATAVVALAVGEDVTQHNGAATSDPQHLRFFVDHRPSWLIAAARDVTNIGAVPVLAVLAVVAAAALWWRGQRVIVAVAPAIALGCTGVVVAVTKLLVARARPDLTVRLVADNESSFPSGHSADSAALLVALAVVVAAVVLRKPLARVLAVGAALFLSGLIGASRLVLAAHWPTDVVAGWAVGLLLGVTFSTVAVLVAGTSPPDGEQSARLRARVMLLLLSRRAGTATRSFAT